MDAQYWIAKLCLEPHPEGGWYRVTYTAAASIPQEALRHGFTGSRPVSTAIYFLLEAGNFSAFHRIRSDEMWHFYAGSPLVVHCIAASGEYSKIRLGAGADFQAVVEAGCWFAAETVSAEGFALVGCTVAPGFDFEDFTLARRDALIAEYPEHRELITRLTR